MTTDADDGWVEAMRQQQRVERAIVLLSQWRRDDQEHLAKWGQHLMGGAVLSCADQLFMALEERSS